MATQPFNVQRWANDASTTLNGAITALDTTVTVTSAAAFPTSGSFHILVDNEELIVESVSGNVFTLEAAATTGHSDGSAVSLMQSNDSLDRAFLDAYADATYPYNRLLNSAATLSEVSFTWFNQGTATCADADDGGLIMTIPSEANWQWRGKYITAPSTPWKVYAYVLIGPGCAAGSSGVTASIIARDSTGANPFYATGFRDDELVLQKFTNNTTFSANVGTAVDNARQGVWMSLEDDGTDITAAYSADGVHWLENWTEGRTTFIAGGPDQVGFAVSSGSSVAGAHVYFKTWIIE